MVALTVGGALAAILTGHVRAGAGFGLGASLAILNYSWLQRAAETLMSGGQVRPSKWVIAKFSVRYPLAFVGVWVFYKTGWLPLAFILAGLFVPVGGALIEAIFLLREGLGYRGAGERAAGDK